MADPTIALLTFFALAAITAAIAWPTTGVVARIRRLLRLTERVRLEDVLKQLYKLEYERLPATVESVAGGVQISRAHAIRLLQRLEDQHFATADSTTFTLTDTGRSYALRIVRTHRLWERFLADRTGTRPEEWHSQAEAREHTLSPQATEELASALGHPVYDPHGDPIPTAEGEIPARSGTPLSSLRPGEHATIIHLEDEPAGIYRELVALGLGVMEPVERLESPSGRVCFRAGGQERDLSSAVARNITVELTAPTEAAPSVARSLAEIAVGESAIVTGISPSCAGPARRRLLDLGVVPGTAIHARMRAAGGDPVAYEIRGALIALRKEQAALIQVETVAIAKNQAEDKAS